ncbi:MAG: dTDP-4-dehydrorhamnose reductase [Proteobacteria bacterium]|nr:dTDP-4-dehydrorhamnose reductase [Pseudomonadota bacterium]
MKALITGAGGQVGRILLKSAPANWTAGGLAHADLDIGDEAAVRNAVRAQRPDLIISAGAYTAVDKAESEPEAAERANSMGPRHLAVAARETGARLLHISTDFVFDGRGSRPYRPDAATDPQSVYGRTKRSGEEAVLQVLPETGVVLRTAWVYAAEGNNFVRTMLRLMSSKGHVRVISDQVGTPTSATSLAEAIWAVAARPDVKGTHHWTDLGVASWYDFAVAIAEEAVALGLVPASVRVDPIATEEYPTPARRPAYSVLDKRSLLDLLGIPARHWRVNLRSVLREIAAAS